MSEMWWRHGARLFLWPEIVVEQNRNLKGAGRPRASGRSHTGTGLFGGGEGLQNAPRLVYFSQNAKGGRA